MPDPIEDFRDFCSQQKWFHAIDFGSVVSSGRFPPGTAQNRTLLGVMEFLKALNLNGSRALDIGTTDGLIAFGMSKLGAASVVATDSVERPTFRRGMQELGLDIDYRPHTQIKDLARLYEPKSFDVIVCAGVIYHMLNPFSAFGECRKLVKDGGYVIFESAIQAGTEPVLVLNSETTKPTKEAYTYWLPTPSAMVGMTKLVSLKPIATRMLAEGNRPFRMTVLAQAVSPSEIPGRSEMLTRIHDVDFCDFEFRLVDIKKPRPSSTVSLAQVAGERIIDATSERIEFPFNPRNASGSVGSTAWMRPTGNF
jgi:2-polyprenyl-3-methyl-5-hydroxy-6-metoxy-1,4-benzoquinol methylase